MYKKVLKIQREKVYFFLLSFGHLVLSLLILWKVEMLIPVAWLRKERKGCSSN